jgi:hopene-associated glycosyltransferase HpnB
MVGLPTDSNLSVHHRIGSMIEAEQEWLLAASALFWVGFTLTPWGPWRNREVLDVDRPIESSESLAEITVVIPARNEAEVIQRTLRSVAAQGADLKINLIDDASDDGTAAVARRSALSNLQIIETTVLPEGWSGKLWALEQGWRQVMTAYTLFVDADIELAPGSIRALKEKMQQQNVAFISLMAAPSMVSGWEKLLMPAFVYFFKALYPFDRVNSRHSKVAAAAGGCILVETRVLERIGGFEPLKSAVIDDCALAQRVKLYGFKIWLGLTHSVQTIRSYKKLADIGNMVARSAFAQLRYSLALLLLCTFVLLLLYIFPVVMLASSNRIMRYVSLISLAIMIMTYLPILRFYSRSSAWALCLPLIAGFFLVMTWIAAIRYWRGERTRWKGRIYRRAAGIGRVEEECR